MAQGDSGILMGMATPVHLSQDSGRDFAIVIGENSAQTKDCAERLALVVPDVAVRCFHDIGLALADESSVVASFWLLVCTIPSEVAGYPDFTGFKDSDGLPPLLVVHPDAWTPAQRGMALTRGAHQCLSEGCDDAELQAACEHAGYTMRARARLRAADSSLVQLADSRSREVYESGERARTFFDYSSDLVFVLGMEENGFLIRASSASAARALLEFDGIPVGTPFNKFLAQSSHLFFSTIGERLAKRLQDTFDLELRARDGKLLRVAVVARRLRGESLDELMLLCRALDVESQAAREPASAVQGLQLLASRAGITTYDVDVRENKITFGGAVQELTGFTTREFEVYQGGRWLVLIHPDDRARVLAQFNAAISTIGKYEFQYRIRQKSGTYRHVEDMGVCVPGKDGRTARVLGTVKDVTHRVEQEEAYRKAETARMHSQKLESLGVLAGGIAHDFNNILAAIIGLTSLALREVADNPELHSDLSEVLNAGNRARDLVRQILTFSRQGDTERVPMDLRKIVAEVIRLAQTGLSPKVRIEQMHDAKVDLIMANPAQMHQVVLNFCTNAIHAMRESGGVLRVSVSRVPAGDPALAASRRLSGGPAVCLSVSDQGHGMTPNVVERIFDPFYTTKGPGEGTGMGLAVAHGIVTMHGGVIDVHSEPGVGTTFRTYLKALESLPVPIETDEGPTPAGQERVAVLRTDDVIGAFVCSTLSHQGYAVDEMHGVESALSRLHNGNLSDSDLFVMDAGLREPGVRDVIDAITDLMPGVPVIVLEDSGYDGAAAETLAKQVILLEKPLTFEQLARATRKALDAT